LSLSEYVLRPFEERIIADFKMFDPTYGGGKARPRKGVWIRGHLLDVKEDYIYRMWKRWLLFVITARQLGATIELGSYQSFRTYIYLLKKHRLVIPTRRERAKSTARQFYRTYYTVNRELLNHPLWENPYSAYESWRRVKERGFPRPKPKGRGRRKRT